MKKVFFAVEGLDGAGKTTLVKNLSDNGFKSLKTPSVIYGKIRKIIHPLKEASLFYYLSSLCFALEVEARNENNFILDRYFFSTITHYVANNKNCSEKEFYRLFHKLEEFITFPEVTFFIQLDFESRVKRISNRSANEKELDNTTREYNDFWVNCMNKYDLSKKIILNGNKTEEDLTKEVISIIKKY